MRRVDASRENASVQMPSAEQPCTADRTITEQEMLRGPRKEPKLKAVGTLAFVRDRKTVSMCPRDIHINCPGVLEPHVKIDP